MWKNFGEKYRLSAGSDTILVTHYRSMEISVIFENIADISVFIGIFTRYFEKFPDISYQSSPRTGYKIYPIFFFLTKKT